MNNAGAVYPSDTTGIKVDDTKPVGKEGCQLSAKLTVAEEARLGPLELHINDKENNSILGVGLIKVAAVPPGPIPTDKPEVDIMWKILPRHAVADSFGNRVADHYFAVEVMIGNNSGYDLQLSAIGFTLSAEDDANVEEKKKLDRIPIDAYPVVRSTIEREQYVGTRAVFVNMARAAGPIMTGIAGFFFNGLDATDNSPHKFLAISSLLASPFEKGLELVYPDLTTQHLVSLDNRTFRDSTVISNNVSVRLNAFISRETIECHKRRRLNKETCEQDVGGTADSVLPNKKRLVYQKDFRPVTVMNTLGKLVVVGRQIQYIQRVRLVSDKNGNPTLPAMPTVTAPAKEVKLTAGGDPVEFVIWGSNLGGENFSVDADGPINVKDVKVEGSTKVTVTLQASAAAEVGRYMLLLNKSGYKSPAGYVTVDKKEDTPNPSKQRPASDKPTGVDNISPTPKAPVATKPNPDWRSLTFTSILSHSV